MKIGFIGLGIMGSRMAANLQKRGHSLVVFNRTIWKHAGLYWNAWETGLSTAADKGWGLLLKW